MSEGFYDAEELRKHVKNLKIQTVALEKEEKQLLEENARFEESNAALKKELNILEALAEVQNADLDDLGDESGAMGSSDEAIRWAEENKKLEVQILNAEIRMALPKLEAEALRNETGIYALQKQAEAIKSKSFSATVAVSAVSESKEVKEDGPSDDTVPAAAPAITSMFQKSVQELEDDMGSTIEARIKLRAVMAREADAKRKEKTALIMRISSMRDQLYSLLDEREALRQASNNIKLNLHGEEARVDLLLSKHAEVRDLITQCHPQRGWQHESFMYHTAATDGEIAFEDLPAALRHWIPSPQADLSLHNIESVLRTIRGAPLDKVALPAYIELASKLDQQAQ